MHDPIEDHLDAMEAADAQRNTDDDTRQLEERAVAEAVARERATGPHVYVSSERVRLEREVARLHGRLR